MTAAGAAAGPGTLFVVATPIGNLADASARALETLAAADLVAAEDTRVTARLLARHGIRARLASYHARNAALREPELLERLRRGERVALVTDAGTPGVSDPGAGLVARWAAEGGRVVPVPGPSAVLAAVSATGICGPRWSFEGFLPRSGRERRQRLARVAADERGCVLFEAPRRLAATLRDLAAVCGPDRPAAVCRELTKVHEEIVHGSLGTLAARATSGALDERGEAVIVIGWQAPAAAGPAADELGAARAAVERLVAQGAARSEAVRRVAGSSGVSRRELYRPRPEA